MVCPLCYMVYHIADMPGVPQTTIDPEFWNRLRDTLKAHMRSTGLKQKALATKLGIDQTTLNNFLNCQSDRLGGLAVALACTMLNLVCDGATIGRVIPSKRSAKGAAEQSARQLVLEFDGSFESKRGSKNPTIVLRKPADNQPVRLSIKSAV